MSKLGNRVYKFGPFFLDAAGNMLLHNGEAVPLTVKALKILLILVQNSGQVVEKDDLMKEVWPDTFVEESNLTQHIFMLRRALGSGKNSARYIETLPKRGYRFSANVVVSSYEGPRQDSETQVTALSHNEDMQVSPGATREINSIVVLPMVNLGEDSNTEYLTDGLTEAITNILFRLPRLRVLALGSIFRYKRPKVDPLKIGRELGVQAVLAGQVIQAASRLIIKIELIEVESGRQVWCEQYDCLLTDILKTQEEIARKLSKQLRLKLTNEEREQLAKRYTDNIEAYHLYLKGRYCWNNYYVSWVKKSIEYFKQAIEVDPFYALAYAGLADAYLRLSNLHLPPRQALPKAKAAAMKALEIDGSLAEAHTVAGVVKLYYDHDWTGAEQEIKRAIELNPQSSIAHQRYGEYLIYMGNFDEGIIENKFALELDPLSLQINTNLATNLYIMGRYNEAINQIQKTLDLNTHYYPARYILGLIYIQQGYYIKAVDEFEMICRLEKDSHLPLGFMGYAYAKAGNRQQAEKILARLKEVSERKYVSPYAMTITSIGLGQEDQIFEWLNKLYEDQNDWLIFLKVAPEFDSLRSMPQFKGMLQRIGFNGCGAGTNARA